MTSASFSMIRVGYWLGCLLLLTVCSKVEPEPTAPMSLLDGYMQDPLAVERGARIYSGT